ncbi:MAG: S9 family peptidase [Bacteroidales bacterium]|nr:S9 family peptidase [Bacteroidales bacterium]
MKKVINLFVLVFVVFALNAQTKISLSDIYQSPKFRANTVDGVISMKDGTSYTNFNMGRNAINKFSYETGKQIETIFKAKDFSEVQMPYIFDYQFNADETQILVSTNYEPIYRHSFKADYYIYNLADKTLKALSENGAQQLACFSPDGKKVSFVRDNNIYIIDLENNSEKAITDDGKWNNIINGAPDWVYEEEFSFSQAYEWSPDSKYLAFMKFDESHVKMFTIDMYGDLYPDRYEFKYPKAGEENSIVDVYIHKLEDGKNMKVDIAERGDDYIPRIKWTNLPGVLSVVHLNRLQNHWTLLLANAENGLSNKIIELKDEKYIEISDDFMYLNDGQRILMTNENDGFRHIYLYDIDGRELAQITKGEWEVTKLYGYDEINKKVFYQSSEVSPLDRSIYSISIDGSNKKCLTESYGTSEAEFSSNFSYFINTYSDANTPYLICLFDAEGNKVREIENNNSLKKTIKETYQFTEKEFISFTSSEGIELNGWMIKPPKFNPRKKYPVFMYVYGGPGHQTVTNSWDYQMPWWQMLAQNGYIVVSIDNRGTGARGKDFRQVTYGQLGKYEVIDQIEGAKYLGKQKFVDADRIGIFGWSYGGYMTALCMTIGADYFKAGLSVAPVTNWRYYDTVYTERYNGLPQDNASGYDDNSPINHMSKLKGKFLLVHGMADDNVHFQNATELVNKLVDNDKQFETMYYPNRNHGIYGGNTRMHLYTMMNDFIFKNL